MNDLKDKMQLTWLEERKLAEYRVSEVYFFVTYPDVDMYYPLIETYVFLGMNFSDEDLVDVWYFQPVADFVEFGSALDGVYRPVFCATKEQLIEFQDVQQLAKTLNYSSIRKLESRTTLET